MSKAPIFVGDAIKLRGREPCGIVVGFGQNKDWVVVDWSTSIPGPKYVHIKEIEHKEISKDEAKD